MRAHLIDWVDARARLWGIAKRRLDLKLENWPESVWARIRDGVPPESFREQHFAEVFEGDALIFRRSLIALTAKQYRQIYVHYVIPLAIKEKIAGIGQSRENYYKVLANAHQQLARVMESGLAGKLNLHICPPAVIISSDGGSYTSALRLR